MASIPSSRPGPTQPRIRIPELIREEGEQDGSPPRKPDGCSFYRSLARQMQGDPNTFWRTQAAVLDHYVRVFIDQGRNDSLSATYTSFDIGLPTYLGPFFHRLASPDTSIADATQQGGGDVLSVICNTFNIRLVVWADNNTVLHQQGSVTCPEYHMKLVSDTRGKRSVRFDSLIPDESGSSLVTYLLDFKSTNSQLDMREITWWGDQHDAEWTDERILNALDEPDPRSSARNSPLQARQYKCYNEYLPEAERWQKPDLRDRLDSFTVFTVSVTKPQEIRAALSLIDEALKRAPAQELPVAYQDAGNFRPLRRYIGIDAEFSPIVLSDELVQQESEGKDKQIAYQIDLGKREELCTVLTIAVDRHLVFSFYILHMLQNAEDTTVEELSLLFTHVIFNDELLKLWFNYQSDIVVLDATIAHMYQGTIRPPHLSKLGGPPWARGVMITPTYKIRSPFFQAERPDALQFPHSQLECPLHRPGFSATGLNCPCVETSNIDITTVLDFICRQLRYTRELDEEWDVDPAADTITGFPITSMARPWTDTVFRYNYGKMMEGLMGTDRLHALLAFFKDVPKFVASRLNRGIQGRWYTLFKPGMEVEEDMMGYNIGDVVGIALLMRLLTTTDDRHALAARLLNHDHVPDDELYATVKPLKPSERSRLQVPGDPNLAIINDYPKLWNREIIGDLALHDVVSRPADFGTNQRIGTVFRGRRDFWSRPEPYYKHEPRHFRRALGRNAFYSYKQHGAFDPAYIQAEAPSPESDQIAHEFLFDPTDYTLPALFAADVDQANATNDVDPGTSHSDDLGLRIAAESMRRGGAFVTPPRGWSTSKHMQYLVPYFGHKWTPVPPTPPTWPQNGGGPSDARLAALPGGG